MKLLIVAALIAACAAGRLDHLERSYLPPDSSNTLGFGFNSRSQNRFGSDGQGSQGFGSHGSSGHSNGDTHGALGSNGGSGTGFGLSSGNSFGSSNGNGFGAATSNQYLPPNFGSSGSNGLGRSGSSAPSTQYGTPSSGNNNGFGAQAGSQYQQAGASHYAQGRTQPGSGVSNQYLTPARSAGFQNIPQQSFDEQTGYHY